MPESQHSPLKVLLASPRGFCAGVVRAIDIVERALELYGAPVYVRHEIVHNRHVVDKLRRKGASKRLKDSLKSSAASFKGPMPISGKISKS